MEIILVALIASIVGPTILAFLNNKARRADKIEDWKREDIVAEKAEEVAKKLQAATSATNLQLNAIHTLVNSNMTAAMQAQLVALQGQLVVMNRLAEIEDPTVDEAAAMESVQRQIAELTAALKDRLLQQQQVEKEEEEEEGKRRAS